MREKDGEERSRAEEVEDAAAGEGGDDDESGGGGGGRRRRWWGEGGRWGRQRALSWDTGRHCHQRAAGINRRLSPQCGPLRRRPASVRAPRPCTRLACGRSHNARHPMAPIISPTAPAVPRSRSAAFGSRYTHRRNLLPVPVASIIVCPIPAAITVNHALLYVRPVLLAHRAVRAPPPPTTALGQVYTLMLLSQHHRGLADPPHPAFLQTPFICHTLGVAGMSETAHQRAPLSGECPAHHSGNL